MTRIDSRRLALGLSLLVAACSRPESAAGPDPQYALAATGRTDYEVWLVDQSDSRGLTYGGTIYIYDGATFAPGSNTPPPPSDVIHLEGDTDALCMANTGAHVVRPHMVLFNANHTHAVLSFVASGHVVVYDAPSRKPVSCIRTSVGAGGARQAHAAIPAPNDRYILVANQNGKLLERIDADFATNSFRLNPEATLNLATCTTPSGAPCEAAGVRPDNAPICPLVERNSRNAYVTLRGGGLLVVDAAATPIKIVSEYDQSIVHGNGCGGVQLDRVMYLNSGGGTASNLSEFDVYAFNTRRVEPRSAPNTPAPSVVHSDDQSPSRDAHGITISANGRWLWVVDRAANLIEIFDTRTNARASTLNMLGSLSPDPTPDLVDHSPTGDLFFFSLRGPNPLSGDPHVSTGATPGLGVVRIEEGGKRGTLQMISRITNIDAGGVERADAHGIRVRLK